MNRKFDQIVYRSQEPRIVMGTILEETVKLVRIKTRNGSIQVISKDLIISIRHKDLNY